MIDLPKTAYVEIPNSKRVSFSPRVPGVDPTFVDPDDKMEYKPISVIENDMDMQNYDDDDDGNEKTKQINAVELGQLVDTEFGVGTVHKLLSFESPDIWVDIKGIGPVKVPKATVWIIGNKSAARQIQQRITEAGKKGLPRLPAPVLAEIGRRPAAGSNFSEEDDKDDDNTSWIKM